jgi:pilus assembly protein Flp/PilA
MERIEQLMRRFARDESGQGLVEYVLIIALVAVGLIIALTVFRNQIGQTFDNVNTQLNNAPSTPYSPGS